MSTEDIVIEDKYGDTLTICDGLIDGGRVVTLIAREDNEENWIELDSVAVATLRDALTAWLDAPRDAARAEAYILAKTSLGEWGVAEEGEPGATWFADEDQARGHFAAVRGFVRCEGCKAEVSFDDHDTSADVVLCPGCAGGPVTM